MCRFVLKLAAAGVMLAAASPLLAVGELSLTVVDAETQKLIPCRLHLLNDKNRPQRAGKAPFWNDHSVVPGTVKLRLPKGKYRFELEHGPEYLARNGYFIIDNQSKDDKTVDLRRACHLADEGWWSGDLHLHRPARELELLMLADDLHVAGTVTWSAKKNEWSAKTLPAEPIRQFDKNRYIDLVAGEIADAGGTLLLFNAGKPLLDSDDQKDALTLLAAARQSKGWIDVARPTANDLPLWLALGYVDSIELCDDQFGRDGMIDDDAGRPRDKMLMPGASGIARWTHEIYYHALNCGFRIPPTAGSGSGESPNPVGYNRVYVWVDKDQFDYDAWWKGLRLGRAVVTNGPLIRPVADGRFPGHVFHAPADERLVIDVATNFAARDPISYFELIKNGHIAHSIRYEELAKNGRFPPVEFEESGWFLIRAVTDVEETYRFATSAPWYVEIGDDGKRISRSSAEFFLNWLNEREEMLAAQDGRSPAAKKAWAEAKEFWEKLIETANAE